MLQSPNLTNNILVWCNISAINASIMKCKAHVCFNYKTDQLKPGLFLMSLRNLLTKWNLRQLARPDADLRSISACRNVAPVCGRRAISTYILSAADTRRRASDVACCLGVWAALEKNILSILSIPILI